jgi:hypothetical protein
MGRVRSGCPSTECFRGTGEVCQERGRDDDRPRAQRFPQPRAVPCGCLAVFLVVARVRADITIADRFATVARLVEGTGSSCTTAANRLITNQEVERRPARVAQQQLGRTFRTDGSASSLPGLDNSAAQRRIKPQSQD